MVTSCKGRPLNRAAANLQEVDRNLLWSGRRIISIRFSRTSLMTFQPQPLRSHALYILIKFVNFFIEPHALRFWFVAAAQLFKRLLYREFGCFSHADLTSSFLTILMQLRAPPAKFALIKIKATDRKKSELPKRQPLWCCSNDNTLLCGEIAALRYFRSGL